MGSLVGSEHEGLAMEKTYNCKICGKAFSSGRVLGGHVRSHKAAASLATRKLKSPVFAEKSESDSCLTDRASDDGGRDSGKSPRNSMESFGTGEKKIGSGSSENRCVLCEKGFGSRRALFGHLRVHSSSKQRVKGQRDQPVLSPVVRVSSVEVVTGARTSSLEKALSECEIICPTTRRKRSVRVRCSGNEPGNDVFFNIGTPPSTLLSSKDEMEAAMGLLMISTCVESWKYSDGVKNSSGFLQIGSESHVLDDLLPGVGDKRRRLGEVDDAAPEMLKIPGCTDSFLIDSNVKGKGTEYQDSRDMISGGVEVCSFGTGGVVEEMRSLVVVDVLEGEKIPDLRSDDEQGGGNRRRMLPDTDCRKGALTFLRRGYKCKSCGRIFPTQQELGDHRVTSCCCSANPEKTDDKEVNGEGTCSPSHADGLDSRLSIDGAAASKRNHHGALLLDLNVPVEVFE